MAPVYAGGVRLASVTVTYHPEIEALRRQWAALPDSCMKLLVDNGSGREVRRQLAQFIHAFTNAHVVFNDDNLGLAAAINQGVRAVRDREPGIAHVLLLDQDSEPAHGACDRLMLAFEQLRHADTNIGCVGPLLLDPDTGLQHGFHQHTRWRWRRVYPVPGSSQPIPCENLNGSGTLADVEIFLRLGGLDESLFIDHVDTDWAFRVVAAGFTLWGIPDAIFKHRMGQACRRIWCLGWRIWPMRSPVRHYYLFRNAVRLVRRDYVPLVWKAWVGPKLAITIFVTLLIGPSRLQQMKRMLAGIWAGMVSD